MEEHIVEKAELYWQHELDAATRKDVERHLARCAVCRSEFDAIAPVIRTLDQWRVDEPLNRMLEDRLVALRPRSTVVARVLRVAAIALMCFASAAGGYAVRGNSLPENSPVVARPVADTTLRTYILLLEEPTWPPPAPLERAGYREWSRSLTAIHRYVGAEKLTEEPGVRLASDGRAAPPSSSDASRNLSGWYLLRARDYAEAVRLARQGPHLAYGSILVRQLEGPGR